MIRKYLTLALSALLLAQPALAQNAASGSPRVQGTPDGFGDPVQVTVVGPNGADMTGTTANQVQGNAASGATDSGNPVKIGGIASNTTPTAVTAGQRANAWFDLNGALVVAGGSNAAGTDALANTVYGMRGPGSAGCCFNLGIMNHGYNGSTWDRMRGDTNAIVVAKGLTAGVWRYSNGATGILSNTTTAVTIKAAAGAGVRNYIDSCQINTTAFGTSVPIAIRDGAGGTVIFALNVPTAGFLQPVTIVFETPLQGTANTLLEVVTPTANTSGTAWVNCQGHTGN